MRDAEEERKSSRVACSRAYARTRDLSTHLSVTGNAHLCRYRRYIDRWEVGKRVRRVACSIAFSESRSTSSAEPRESEALRIRGSLLASLLSTLSLDNAKFEFANRKHVRVITADIAETLKLEGSSRSLSTLRDFEIPA